jgi:pimeloyl-ACP methyl ester carboxylesterase
MAYVPPPGRLVEVGGFRLHLHCAGAGSPAVVLDAALGASSVSWSLVQPLLAATTRVCSYDRAGFGWSEAGPMPRTAGRMADELRTLLGRAGVAPPYVLVGHSFGGLVMRIFAARHRAESAALVLVDPAHPEDWVTPAPKEQARIDRGVRLCGHGARAARLGLARVVSLLVSAGALGAARGLVSLATRGGLSRQDEGILAPVSKLPPTARRPLAQFWTRPGFFDALGSQIGAVCVSARETLEAGASGYGDLPLITISSTDPGEYRLRQQEALARLSTRGQHVMASNSGHWIPLDEPQLVVDIVKGAVLEVRRDQARAELR